MYIVEHWNKYDLLEEIFNDLEDAKNYAYSYSMLEDRKSEIKVGVIESEEAYEDSGDILEYVAAYINGRELPIRWLVLKDDQIFVREDKPDQYSEELWEISPLEFSSAINRKETGYFCEVDNIDYIRFSKQYNLIEQ